MATGQQVTKPNGTLPGQERSLSDGSCQISFTRIQKTGITWGQIKSNLNIEEVIVIRERTWCHCDELTVWNKSVSQLINIFTEESVKLMESSNGWKVACACLKTYALERGKQGSGGMDRKLSWSLQINDRKEGETKIKCSAIYHCVSSKTRQLLA